MNRSLLVRLCGFPATLVHGDTLVLDRWRWLRSRLPRTLNQERLLDVGCGNGAFSIGAALRGYLTVGLSWDARDQGVAAARAVMCGATHARFELQDVRKLDGRNDLKGAFDIALCLETIEHVLDDKKLVRDIASCLRGGGKLLLSTPYALHRRVTPEDKQPVSSVEDGRHVRYGYTPAMLEELCCAAGLTIEGVSFCGGYLSQRITVLWGNVASWSPILAWSVLLPLRPLPPLLDGVVTRFLGWPYFSVCIEAYKPGS